MLLSNKSSILVAKDLGVWFPAVRTGTGTDLFTIRLAAALEKLGARTEISWLPHRAEYFPWSVSVPRPPSWANVAHINSWLHRRFFPQKLPTIVTVHSAIHTPVLNKHKKWMQQLYHRYWVFKLEKYSIEHAGAVTAVSRYAADQAEKAFSYSGIKVIQNWINTEAFSPSGIDRPYRPFRLLFVGNVAKKLKGADLLIPILNSLGAGYELWYTGSPDDLAGVKADSSNFVALGYLKTEAEIIAAYQACDVLLFPTRLEGFGLVAIEAQACGLPVIATNCSSLPEVVDAGVTGVLCPIDNVETFASAIRGLQEEPEALRTMSLAARNHTISRFSESVAIEKYVALYRQLIKCNNKILKS